MKKGNKVSKTLIVLTLLLIVVGIIGCTKVSKDSEKTSYNDIVSTDDIVSADESVQIDLYVMSQCPYGLQVENVMPDVKKKLGDALDLNIEYIGAEKDGTFNSLHGAPEIAGNIIQLCVKDKWPEKMLDFIVCQNKNDPRNLQASIDLCAEEVGINASHIKDCHQGGAGDSLLSASFKKANEINAQASPTIFVNGKPYKGGREAKHFIKAACGFLQGSEVCKGIPICDTSADCIAEPGKEAKCLNPGKVDAKCEYREPEKFDLTIVTSKDCTNCNVDQLKGALQQAFLGAQIKEVDAADEPELVMKNNIKKVPAFLFGAKVAETPAWKESPELAEAFEQVDFGYKLKDAVTGATYWVDKEGEEKFIKELGVQKGDNKPQVDFFVMSYCPFGNEAEEALTPVSEKFGDKVEFKPHYVIYNNYEGGGPNYCYDDESKYCSMHGVVELNQGVREYIVWQEYGTAKMFEFMKAMNDKCNSKNADECWKDIASGMDIDVEKVKQSFDSSAADILKEELDLNKKFGVSGSPTVFIDGERYNAERSPKGYAEAICKAFETSPEECNDLSGLQGASAQAAPEGGCGV
jgi:predicted DsbA family dithiol-disulfide isomerase